MGGSEKGSLANTNGPQGSDNGEKTGKYKTNGKWGKRRQIPPLEQDGESLSGGGKKGMTFTTKKKTGGARGLRTEKILGAKTGTGSTSVREEWSREGKTIFSIAGGETKLGRQKITRIIGERRNSIDKSL